MTVTLGEVAGLIAAVALCVLVGLAAVPLLKLGRTLDEARLAIRDLGQHSVPVLTELRGTVENTNDELAKLSLVTEDLSRASGHATVVTENAARLSQLFAVTLGSPLIKAAALTHGVRTAWKGRRK
ncbi:DUF948 domain-containing protein [Arachnia propionica]|uniref:DUF948 domain-containing protein n=1 Tax=Arachnia propionica TaxID=1750 RepID=UPI0021AB3F05|nr:DUF948 domain-containing protein [Arachnia propionica]MDO5081950.1 DUF948 domain-containing protein [Arachnia propionica]